MSCAALAEIRAADYPDAVRVYDEGQAPRSFEQAERAVLGLQWRQRQRFAEDLARQAFAERFGRPPTAEELGEERRRWVRMLRGFPAALREAVETNCEILFEAGEKRRRAGPVTR